MARPKGTAQVTSLSRGRSHPRAGLSRTWQASPSPSPNGHLPWLPGTRVLGRQSSVGSVVAHGQRQSGGACGAAEGLLPATTMFGLPALELLGDTLLVVSDTLRGVLGLLGLPWETPLWAALLVWVVQESRPRGVLAGLKSTERPGGRTDGGPEALKPSSHPLWRPALPRCNACAWRHFLPSPTRHLPTGKASWEKDARASPLTSAVSGSCGLVSKDRSSPLEPPQKRTKPKGPRPKTPCRQPRRRSTTSARNSWLGCRKTLIFGNAWKGSAGKRRDGSRERGS